MIVGILRLPFSLHPLIAEAKRRMRRRRLWIAASLVLIGGIAAAVATSGSSGGPGSSGGGPGVHGLLSQVRSSFGDGRLLSASVSRRTLTVRVAVPAPKGPSSISATFEAQELAAALHDAQAAAGHRTIDSVQFVDGRGKALPGYGPARVGTNTARHPLPQIPALASGACMAAAQAVQTSSLIIESVLQLPYAGGACAFTFQTPGPASFVPMIVGYKLLSPISDSDHRSYLVEVDNQAGVPVFADDFTPGGGGVSYVKPGYGIIFGP